MIASWDDLLIRLRQGHVPGTTLSGDTVRRLEEITTAAEKPGGIRPHRAPVEVVESRLQTLGVSLPVEDDQLSLGEISFFWRDFFPYETPDCEGSVLAAVHDATKTVRVGGVAYPVVWSGNQAAVTMPREIVQAPSDADVPAWLQETGCEIRFGKKGAGLARYERVPRPDDLLERAVEALIQPQWRDLQHDWRLLVQPVTWKTASAAIKTRWCVPVGPRSGTVPTDDFAVCESQTWAWRGARQLLAGGLARLMRPAQERDLRTRILAVMPEWDELTDDIVLRLPIQALS